MNLKLSPSHVHVFSFITLPSATRYFYEVVSLFLYQFTKKIKLKKCQKLYIFKGFLSSFYCKLFKT